MAYSPVVQVAITINAISLTQAGFGTPIFITAHQQVDDRVIDITSTKELLDLGFASNSPAVIAAGQFFKNSPSVGVVKIGRRLGATTCTVNSTVLDTEVYSITITHRGTDYSASFTVTDAGGAEDSFAVASALASTLNGLINPSELEIVATGAGSTGNISVASLDPDFTFQVETSVVSPSETGSFSNNYVADSGESAAVLLASLSEYNDDFYFVTTEVRHNDAGGLAFCREMSAAVQQVDKQYFIASALEEDITLDPAGTSLFVYLANNGATHTTALWHHYGTSTSNIGESYPECYYVGFNAPYDAGTVTWSNLSVGIPASAQPTNTSKALTTTQKGKLIDGNVNFVEADAGLNVLRTGVTIGGEWIDVIRGVHWLTSEFNTSLKGLLYGQKGGKVSFTNVGIARVREVCHSALQRAVNRGFLDSFELTVPLVANVPNNEWVQRVLKGVKFTGILSGAIHTVEVSGEVTTPSAV